MMAKAPPAFNILTKPATQPKRIFLYGPEGSGKTSLCAHAPKPIFLQTKGETGLSTLIDAGRLPEIPHFDSSVADWPSIKNAISWLATSEHDYLTLVVDAAGGAEEACCNHIRKTQFNDSVDQFLSYGKGMEAVTKEWADFLNLLDFLRESKGMTIFVVGHSVVLPQKNPSGEDYDRYVPALNQKKVWPQTKRWADAILFMNFFTTVVKADKNDKTGKGSGGKQRFMYTEHDASYDAKNRYGLPDMIDCGGSPQDAWSNLATAFQNAKEGK